MMSSSNRYFTALLFIFLTLTLGCGSESVEPIAEASAGISGRAIWPDGSPAVGVDVFIVRDRMAEKVTITNSEGSFRVQGTEAGKISLVLHDRRGAGVIRSITVYGGGRNEAGDLVLHPLAESPKVFGIRGIGYEERTIDQEQTFSSPNPLKQLSTGEWVTYFHQADQRYADFAKVDPERGVVEKLFEGGANFVSPPQVLGDFIVAYHEKDDSTSVRELASGLELGTFRGTASFLFEVGDGVVAVSEIRGGEVPTPPQLVVVRRSKVEQIEVAWGADLGGYWKLVGRSKEVAYIISLSNDRITTIFALDLTTLTVRASNVEGLPDSGIATIVFEAEPGPVAHFVKGIRSVDPTTLTVVSLDLESGRWTERAVLGPDYRAVDGDVVGGNTSSLYLWTQTAAKSSELHVVDLNLGKHQSIPIPEAFGAMIRDCVFRPCVFATNVRANYWRFEGLLESGGKVLLMDVEDGGVVHMREERFTAGELRKTFAILPDKQREIIRAFDPQTNAMQLYLAGIGADREKWRQLTFLRADHQLIGGFHPEWNSRSAADPTKPDVTITDHQRFFYTTFDPVRGRGELFHVSLENSN